MVLHIKISLKVNFDMTEQSVVPDCPCLLPGILALFYNMTYDNRPSATEDRKQ